MSAPSMVAPATGGEPANMTSVPSPSPAAIPPSAPPSAPARDDDVMPEFSFLRDDSEKAPPEKTSSGGEPPKSAEPAGVDKPWLKAPQFFNAQEKDTWQKLGPETIENIKPVLDGFLRRDGEREKGVEKFLAKLGPLRGVADNPPLIEAINIALTHPHMAAAMDRMLEAFVQAPDKANFDPATVFGTAAPAPSGAATETNKWQEKVAALAKMSKEERELEFLANPDLFWQGLMTVSAQAQKRDEDARREMAPIIEGRKEAEAETRAHLELEAWLAELPPEFQSLDGSGKEAVFSAMQKEVEANNDVWAKRGYAPGARLELAYERVFHRVLDEQSKSNKEAKLRSSRTDDLTASREGQSAPALGKNDISEAVLRRVQAETE